MDRLQALIAVALFAALGCDDTTTHGAPLPSRVEAVAARHEDATEELCDIAPSPSEAQVLAFPELASGQAPGAPRHPRWLNVWATWCGPCVEEMPMIVEWSERMQREGNDVDLVFLSSDATDEAVASFREAHPNAPESLRMRDPAAVAQWATSVGLDPGATLPIHVFTDPQGRVRCARTGSVGERDEERVRTLVRQLAR